MELARWQKIDQLFHSALERKPEGRAAFLSQACSGDDSLRREVQSLIESHSRSDSFIEAPAADIAAELLGWHESSFEPGQQIENYRIVRQLGSGGMGEVYLADDTRLNRMIALKLLPRQFTIHPDRVRRFKREARAASALNHPNIVTIYEIGQSNSAHFIATEFVDGKTLRQLTNEKPFTLSETLNVVIQVAGALTGAHDAGIVHRDIKPENIMLRADGYVKVLDFGLAKLTEPQITDSELETPTLLQSNPGLVMGTVQYMSPEQARGKKVDVRTDIWSLGIVLHELLAGRVPFSGETPSHVMVSLMEDELPPLTSYADVPAELERIVTKALRKNQKERYQTASQLTLDLKSLKRELQLEEHLKGSLEAVPGSKERTTKRDGQAVGPALAATRTVDLRVAHPTLSAEYLVGEIKRHQRGVILAAAAMIVLFTTLAYSFYIKRGGEYRATSGEAIDSVAVLPFVNENGDPNTEYLADGISDSVINSLSRLPGLRVISRSAVEPYQGKQIDPQKVGRDLNVGAVLISRMTQRGDDLTISTELVDVRDNRRLWGEQYNRKLADILSVQDEIARKISEGLRLRLGGEERKQLEKRYTQNPEAYRLYSLGRYHSEDLTREGLEKGVEYYEQAIKVDPMYALAYVGLSKAQFDLQAQGFEIPKEASRRFVRAALKAVELDDTLSEAHVALALVKAFHLDWTGAEKECKRALELDPKSLDANRRYAMNLAYEGRVDEALVYAKRADELDQTRSRPARLGFIYFLARQYDAAIEQYLKAIENSPDNAQFHFLLGEAYVAKGMYKEAIAELQEAVALNNIPERWDRYPILAYAYAVSGQRDEALKILAEQKRLAKQGYIAAYNFAVIYIGLGDKDRAFEYLNKSFGEGRPLMQFPSRPLFDGLRSDQRYTELLRRIGRTP